MSKISLSKYSSMSPEDKNKRKYAGRGRKITFDPDKALYDAMMVFWEKGYDATTYEDLVRATGVQRYGLYKVLGDKDQAYEKVLDHYVNHTICELTAPLREPDAGLVEVLNYFNALVAFNTEKPYGCMACNSVAANKATSPCIAQMIEAMLTMVQESLAHALKSAKSKGELNDNADIDELSQMLLGVMVAASTLFRLCARRTNARNLVQKNLEYMIGGSAV